MYQGKIFRIKTLGLAFDAKLEKNSINAPW